MGTRVPTIYVLSKYKKNVNFFHLKLLIFTAFKITTYCKDMFSYLAYKMFVSVPSDVSSNLIKIDRLNYIQTDFNLWLNPHTVYSKAQTKLDNLTKQQDFKYIDFRLHKIPKSFLNLQNQNLLTVLKMYYAF